MIRTLLLMALVPLVVAGCGGDDGATGVDVGFADGGFDSTLDARADAAVDGGSNDGGEDASALAREPQALDSLSGCLIDLDCAPGHHCFEEACVRACGSDLECGDGASCDERGRCLSASKAADEEAERPNGRIVEVPQQRIRLAPGATSFDVVFGVESDGAPLDALDYRLEDEAGLLDASVRQRAPVDDDGLVTIAVPLGYADLVGDEAPFNGVSVVTAIGLQRFHVSARAPAEGAWVAEARAPSLGSVTLPLEFEIATEPPNVPVEDADAVFVALSTADSHLFRPRPDAALPLEVRELTYDALLQQWVGTWRHDFDGPAGSFLERTGTREPQRALRMQIAFEDGEVAFGTLTDRWTGFYDERTAGGVATPATTVVELDFEARRFSDGTIREVMALRAGADDASTFAALRPPLELGVDTATACADADLRDGDGPLVIGEFSCEAADGSVLSIADLATLSADEAASCALAVADAALAGPTTVDAIQSYYDGRGGVDGLSFSAFVEACAEGADGFCRPSAQVMCARDLTAWAYATPVEEVAASAELVERWTRLARESYLGAQLGAFERDASLRLEWLEATDYPDFVLASLADGTEALGGYIGELLEEWSERVLDVQLSVLNEQLDLGGLSLLSRPVTDAGAIDERLQVLLEISQSWRAVMDALTLGATRWNVVLRGASDRDEATARVVSRSLDLYVMAGLLAGTNQRAGAGFANATFGGGFGALQRAVTQLSLPFDKLLISRDAEVVVSRSLSPAETNQTLLATLRAAATDATEAAGAQVRAIIADSARVALEREQLENRLDNEIGSLRDEILELCGLPPNCTPEQIATEAEGCALPVGPEACGYQVGPDGAIGPSASEAGAALQAIIEAQIRIVAAQTEIQTTEQRAERAEAAAAAYAVETARMHEIRQREIDEIDALIAAREAEYTEEMAAIAARYQAAAMLQDGLANDAAADARAWNQIAVSGLNSDIGQLRAAAGLEATARVAQEAGNFLANRFRESADALPSICGTAQDASYRGALYAARNKRSYTRNFARLAAAGVSAGADFMATSVGRERQYRDINLRQLADVDFAADLSVRNAIEELRDQARVQLTDAQVQEWGFDRMVAAALRASEAALATERELLELERRRDDAWSITLEYTTLNTQLYRELLALERAELDYARIVERGLLLFDRYRQLQEQRGATLQLVGSPSTVFAWANQLSQAEASLNTARSALWEWLVALEYYAVRPFVDLRIQLLLAQNPYQFEDIAAQLDRLSTECGGGQVSYASAVVSLAEAMGFTADARDSVTGGITPAQNAFQAALARGDVSVGRRVRLGSTLFGADLWSLESLWSGSLSIDIERFPNLAASCNARLFSVDLAVVGEFSGEELPVVRLVHAGTSKLRSCQANIRDYIDSVGPESTTFREVTSFEMEGRGIAPVADIGTFAEPPNLTTGNTTLQGLPLASEYIVMIERAQGDNANIPWDRLEDVLIRFTFSYQDPYPQSECN